MKPISSLAAGLPQYYDGAINTVGIDVGVTAGNDPGLGRVRADTGLPQGALASILLQPVRPFAIIREHLFKFREWYENA